MSIESEDFDCSILSNRTSTGELPPIPAKIRTGIERVENGEKFAKTTHETKKSKSTKTKTPLNYGYPSLNDFTPDSLI
jgi:hypothetical protein